MSDSIPPTCIELKQAIWTAAYIRALAVEHPDTAKKTADDALLIYVERWIGDDIDPELAWRLGCPNSVAMQGVRRMLARDQ